MSDEPSLKEKTAKGLAWGGFSNGAMQLLNLLFGIVLARLLTPADYGMVGQLTIFSLIANTLQESGFTAALTNRPTIEQRYYNAVFWFCLPLSITIYVILWFVAPLISQAYQSPELTSLARYLFISFVISSLGIVPSALLFKQMKVKERTISNLSALIISGSVGILMAYHGMEYWGIATQTIVYVSMNMLGYWIFSRWRPSFTFDFAPIREMWGFSSLLVITNVINHLNNNLLTMLLGLRYSDKIVGDYTQGNKWGTMGHSLITGVLQGVAQPMFVAAGDNPERQLRIFRKMQRFTAFISFPLMFGLALTAREVILITIGEKWLASTEILSLLAIGGAFLPLATLYGQFALSKQRSDIYLRNIAAMLSVQLIVALLLLPHGILYMLIGYVTIQVIWCGVWHRYLHRTLSLNYGMVARDLLPFLITALCSMTAAYAVVQWYSITSLLVSLTVKIAVAASLYLSILYIARAEILREALKYLSTRLRP